MPKSMETMLIEHTSTAGHGETLVGFAGGGCSRWVILYDFKYSQTQTLHSHRGFKHVPKLNWDSWEVEIRATITGKGEEHMKVLKVLGI